MDDDERKDYTIPGIGLFIGIYGVFSLLAGVPVLQIVSFAGLVAVVALIAHHIWIRVFEAPAAHYIPIFAFIALLGLRYATSAWGECRPGSPFERSEYIAWVYVEVIPKSDPMTTIKTPARIEATRQSNYDDEGGASWTDYFINWMQLPNGDEIGNPDPDYDPDALVIRIGRKDPISEDYYGTLTSELLPEGRIEELRWDAPPLSR